MIALGVDVGGPRKGCDVAVLDGSRLVALVAGCGVDDVRRLAREHGARACGVDAPCACAPDGARSRADERELVRVTGVAIRYTPDAATVHGGNPYYAWIRVGLAVHAALPGAVEVFPTASWTAWLGPRGGRSRAAWSTAGLARLGLSGLPARTNQDQRDAIAAALTARLDAEGRGRRCGAIAVPAPGLLVV
ncbi:MAG: DUF429 domain-containing protein [Solirubrobacteraceae bacterium]|nr:DUF429 domain-containing protein [Solirubrobacteraceae bacterium]